jgi:hypothetical protein
MGDINDLSEKVMENSKIPKDEKFGSVLIAIMVIGIIVNVIRVIQECEEDKKNLYNKTEYAGFIKNRIIEISNRRSFMSTMKLKRILRKNLDKEVYDKYKTQLVNGLFKTGTELTENEIYTLLEHSND